jgi:hypothetical protein
MGNKILLFYFLYIPTIVAYFFVSQTCTSFYRNDRKVDVVVTSITSVGGRTQRERMVGGWPWVESGKVNGQTPAAAAAIEDIYIAGAKSNMYEVMQKKHTQI